MKWLLIPSGVDFSYTEFPRASPKRTLAVHQSTTSGLKKNKTKQICVCVFTSVTALKICPAGFPVLTRKSLKMNFFIFIPYAK